MLDCSQRLVWFINLDFCSDLGGFGCLGTLLREARALCTRKWRGSRGGRGLSILTLHHLQHSYLRANRGYYGNVAKGAMLNGAAEFLEDALSSRIDGVDSNLRPNF